MMTDSESLRASLTRWRRFLDASEDETTELVHFDHQGKPSIAYTRSLEATIAMVARGDVLHDVVGFFTVFNELHEGLYARIGESTFDKGRFIKGANRAGDKKDVTHPEGLGLA
jgi:hypothetical protein